MKKMNKKGFTIVELVIVIAVIAILAAVLIPTFSGVVEKANDSAALQGARNAFASYMTAHAGDDGDVDLVLVKGEYAYVVENGQINATKITGYTENAAKAAITGDTVTGKYVLDDSAEENYVTVDSHKYVETSDGTAKSGETYYTYTEAENYTNDDFVTIDSKTYLISECTVNNAATGDEGKDYTTVGEDKYVVGSASVTTKTTSDVKTPASVSPVTINKVDTDAEAANVVYATVTYTIVSDVTAEGGWTIYSAN